MLDAVGRETAVALWCPESSVRRVAAAAVVARIVGACAVAVGVALARWTTWIVRRTVSVRTSGVGVAVGTIAATFAFGGEVGRAIAAAATPPRAERTAMEAMRGVRKFMSHTIGGEHPSDLEVEAKLWQSLVDVRQKRR